MCSSEAMRSRESISLSKQSFASGGERNVFFLRLGKRRPRRAVTLEASLADVGAGTPFAIEGEEVVIHGLLGASSSVLNGCTGELISRVVSNGRFRVRIADTSGSRAVADARQGIVAVMPGNLRFITTGAAGLYCDYSWSCCWVAKENKRIEDTVQKEVEFHEKSLLTQATAAAMARGFNDLVKSRRLPFNTPRVTYLEECFFIQAKPWSITMQGDEATRLFFVEAYLDGKYRKWNTNFGTISWKPTQPSGNSFAAQPPALAKKQHPNTLGLGGIIEEDEEEDGDDFDDFDGLTLESNRSSSVGFVPVGEQPTVDNVPQAFTHWTHVKKMHAEWFNHGLRCAGDFLTRAKLLPLVRPRCPLRPRRPNKDQLWADGPWRDRHPRLLQDARVQPTVPITLSTSQPPV